jgi:hypothetical protein
MQALTRNVYMRERVQEGCSTGAREFLERINGPGSEFPVDCLARLSWLKSWAELYRLASECDSTESETVSVLVLGYEVPVSCRNRAADQPLIEKWLPPQ